MEGRQKSSDDAVWQFEMEQRSKWGLVRDPGQQDEEAIREIRQSRRTSISESRE
jgi:hypothetical protein